MMTIRATYTTIDPHLDDVAYIGIKVCNQPYVTATYREGEFFPRRTLLQFEDILVMPKDEACRSFEFVKEE
jgi:hypothetical protein